MAMRASRPRRVCATRRDGEKAHRAMPRRRRRRRATRAVRRPSSRETPSPCDCKTKMLLPRLSDAGTPDAVDATPPAVVAKEQN